MENIDKLFSQRFHEQKPENNYNSGLWNDFEKELEQEMPAAKSKRKWWMGWKGLTIFNTILVGAVIFALLYNNSSKLNVQSSKLGSVNELLITNDKLQESSAVEVKKEVSNSSSADKSEKNIVTNRKLQKINFNNSSRFNVESSKLGLTNNLQKSQAIEATEKTDVIDALQKIKLQIPNNINTSDADTKTLNIELSTLNSQLSNNIQTSKPQGPQYKLKLPDWLSGNSHPRHPRKGPKKEKPDIVPVPVEGF